MILIVDDDVAVLHSLELLLKQSGFTTKSAATPLEARGYLESPELELILQDMNFSRQTTGEEGLDLVGIEPDEVEGLAVDSLAGEVADPAHRKGAENQQQHRRDADDGDEQLELDAELSYLDHGFPVGAS